MDQKEFECLICGEILSDAVELVCCSCLCCQGCFNDLIRAGGSCPNCRAAKAECRPIIPIRRIISNMTFECPNMPNCVEKVTYGTREEHKAKCQFAEVNCSLSPQCALVLRKDLPHHLGEVCPWRAVPCGHCFNQVIFQNMQEHLKAECLEVIVECEACGNGLLRKDLSAHEIEVCTEALVPCTFATYGCDTKVKRKELESHLKDSAESHLTNLVVKVDDLSTKLDKKTTEMNDKVDAKVADFGTMVKQLSADYSGRITRLNDQIYALSSALTKEKQLRVAAEDRQEKHCWKLEWKDYKDLQAGHKVTSDDIEHFGRKWYMTVYPNGEKGSISAFLHLRKGPAISVGYRIVLVNSDSSKNREVEVHDRAFNDERDGFGSRSLVERHLITEAAGFLNKGMLELRLYFLHEYLVSSAAVDRSKASRNQPKLVY
eukprot:TRINITY_DN3170_c0_g1_i1.p1 TRINITY_DN3170_c0_g1~~TRINITY_DN3170_c0_g1_i1.p1  ORF type:complete len:447 (-),score=61.14 TRINITY_DN3170_c0_g1_i1:920-2212(-)